MELYTLILFWCECFMQDLKTCGIGCIIKMWSNSKQKEMSALLTMSLLFISFKFKFNFKAWFKKVLWQVFLLAVRTVIKDRWMYLWELRAFVRYNVGLKGQAYKWCFNSGQMSWKHYPVNWKPSMVLFSLWIIFDHIKAYHFCSI